MNATKERIGEDALEELFDGAKKIVAAKGKRVTVLEPGKDSDALAALADVALGPTGNLRAPTLRVGKTWLIGFNEDEYGKVLG